MRLVWEMNDEETLFLECIEHIWSFFELFQFAKQKRFKNEQKTQYNKLKIYFDRCVRRQGAAYRLVCLWIWHSNWRRLSTTNKHIKRIWELRNTKTNLFQQRFHWFERKRRWTVLCVVVCCEIASFRYRHQWRLWIIFKIS